MLSRSYADPFYTMLNRMDRLTARPFSSFDGPHDGASVMGASVPVNVAHDADRYYITAIVPGVAPDKVEITWNKDSLTISGKTEVPSQDGVKALWREIKPFGFSRSIRLGAEVDVEKVEAHLENGVLTITAPKAAAAKPRTIPVQPAAQQVVAPVEPAELPAN